MPDPKETDNEESLNGAGNETEADASTEQGENEDGLDGEDTTEGDGSEAEEVDADGGEEKPRGRGETRFQRLANEAKSAREEAAQVRRELDEIKAQQRQAQPSETPEQEAQKIALMTPEERLEYRLDKAERTNQQNMRAMAFQMQDQGDKSAFSALVTTDPVAAKYKDRVEAELTRIRGLGQNVGREALLDYLIGKDVRAKRGPAAEKQRKAGERNIQRQTTRPAGSRGDSAPNKRGEKSLEDRLADVTF